MSVELVPTWEQQHGHSSVRDQEDQNDADREEKKNFRQQIDPRIQQPSDMLLSRLEDVRMLLEKMDMEFTPRQVQRFLKSFVNQIFFPKLKNPEALLVAYYYVCNASENVRAQKVGNVELNVWDIQKYIHYLLRII